MSSTIEPAVFLTLFDDAWSHSWESLQTTLEGVTEAEAAHVPADYADEELEEGWPAPGSVLWQLAHLAHCKAYYTALIEQRGEEPGNPEPVAFEVCEDYAAYGTHLAQVHGKQREAMAELTREDMPLKVGNGMLLPEFLSMIIRHDIWHASQVAIARRSWRQTNR